jgi:hypothetical protein
MAIRVAIDTNIFVHLTNPHENPDSHIDQLLSHLSKSDPTLCVDSTNKITNEYQEKLGPRIRDQDEKGFAIYLIRFWINLVQRETVQLDPACLLMHRIKQVIHERDEHADRAFVYVSCEGNCPLITNDKTHIVDRRKELKSKTRKLRGEDSRILLSLEAIKFFIHGEN